MRETRKDAGGRNEAVKVIAYEDDKEVLILDFERLLDAS
jgi:hypothetical protein